MGCERGKAAAEEKQCLQVEIRSDWIERSTWERGTMKQEGAVIRG